jgi:DNA helicase II / ATP-dependent DNA helicase PcrA
MSDLIKVLNDQQREAVTAPLGPTLILAGPGSGKTRVLTHRIAYLIREVGIPASGIMAVTFTNKAAGEMRNRIEQLLGDRLRGLQIGTFHATCARMLRREGDHTPFGSDYVIYDTDDQLSVIKQAIGELNIDPKKYSPRGILGKISGAKNELIQPDDFQALDYREEIAQRVYQRYQSILLDNNALDFDDLLMQTVLLLRENDEVLEKHRRLLEAVLVDEFQDTNTAQYELVQLLGRPRNNVFVVGDEDQGIYAFRGADYRNVYHFREDFPDAKVILLEQNYRSTQNVLDVARAVIDKNPNRTPKALFTDKDGGEKIILRELHDERMEAEFIMKEIDALRRDQGHTWSNFAVMYRTNAQSRAIEDAFIRQNIPYRLIGGVGFYKRREIRDLLAYLRVINSSTDRVSFTRIINVPRRGIGRKSLADFQQWALEKFDNDYDAALKRLLAGADVRLSARVSRLFAKFGEDLQRWRDIAATGDLHTMFDTMTSDLGYNLYLHDISDTEEQAMERGENVQELRGLVAQAQADDMSLAEFLAEQSLVSDVDTLADDADSVTLLTLHAAKGLEYPVVFLTGLEEGLLPHNRSLDEIENIAEERRLMYVGITRAQERLYLTHVFRRTLYGRSEASVSSRFLDDVPSSLIDGISTMLGSDREQQRFAAETTWDSPVFGKSKSEEREKVRSKIISFSEAKERAEANATGESSRFVANMRVKHAKFGEGVVIGSKGIGTEEQVTVKFDNKTYPIKTLMADFLTPSES